jgi:hypothetical protein
MTITSLASWLVLPFDYPDYITFLLQSSIIGAIERIVAGESQGGIMSFNEDKALKDTSLLPALEDVTTTLEQEMQKIEEQKEKSAVRLKEAIAKLAEPIKNRLPPIMVVDCYNPSPGGYRAGTYHVVEWEVVSNELFLVGRQFMREEEDFRGNSMGVVYLKPPFTHWRQETNYTWWVNYAKTIIELLEKAADDLAKGKEVKVPTFGGYNYGPAFPLIRG